MRAFGRAAARRQARVLADSVQAVAIGAQSDEKGIKDTINNYREAGGYRQQFQPNELVVLTNG